MANSAIINPYALDTAGAVVTYPVSIKAIRVQFSADGDDVVLSDKNGNVIFIAKAGTVATVGYNDGIVFAKALKVDGLTVTTIDGTSKVYVYLE
jgi:hypothetical protein